MWSMTYKRTKKMKRWKRKKKWFVELNATLIILFNSLLFFHCFILRRFRFYGNRRAHSPFTFTHLLLLLFFSLKIPQNKPKSIENDWMGDWSVSSFAITTNTHTQAHSRTSRHAEWINLVAWLCNNNNNWCEQLCNNYNSKKKKKKNSRSISCPYRISGNVFNRYLFRALVSHFSSQYLCASDGRADAHVYNCIIYCTFSANLQFPIFRHHTNHLQCGQNRLIALKSQTKHTTTSTSHPKIPINLTFFFIL